VVSAFGSAQSCPAAARTPLTPRGASRARTGAQISFGPITWLMVGEIFPLAVRGPASALATVTNFGSNFGARSRIKLQSEQLQ
jgi:hypothetical protein